MSYQIPEPPQAGTIADFTAYIQGLARQLTEPTPENEGMSNQEALRVLEIIAVTAATTASAMLQPPEYENEILIPPSVIMGTWALKIMQAEDQIEKED